MPRHLWISALSGIFLTGFWVILSVVTAAAQSPSPTTIFTTPTADHPYIGKQLLTLPAPPTGDQQPEPSSIAPAQASQPQTPQAMADRWWAAFQSYRSNNWDIYRVRGNGNDFAQLTYHPAADTQPRLNLGVTAITFVSMRDGNPEIYRMNADGGNQIRLTTHPLTDTQPSWSPNSSQIVFVSQRDGNAELYRMNANGAGLQRLTTDPAFDLFPNWSPDGQQLVWVRAAGDNGWLWLMNQDGSNARAISGPLRYLQHPIWSPDGSSIAFDYDPDRDGFNELGLLTVADGVPRLLGDGSQLETLDFAQDLWMGEWSPNGEGLTYSTAEFHWNGDGWLWVYYQILGACLIDDCPSTFFGLPSNSDDFDLFPSIQSEDPFPPQTAIKPLPAYTRRTPTVFVTWDGTDRGSYITGYDIEVRRGKELAWQPWLRSTTLIGDYFLMGPGSTESTFYFRSRGYDDGGNIEPWPTNPDGDTSVTFYVTTLSGRLTDLRGVGRAKQPLSLLPAGLNTVQTNATGDYFVRLPTSGEYQINGLRVNTNGDRFQPFYLEPAQNLIQNGDFEALTPLAQWQPSGTITPTLTNNNVPNGLQGVQLGFDCTAHCVTVDTNIPITGSSNIIPLWTPDGRFHLFFDLFNNTGTGKIYHTERTALNVWTTPELLADGAAFSLQAVGDRNGRLFVTWMTGSQDSAKIITMEYSPAGGWGPPLLFAAGEYPQVAMGEDGSIHLLYMQRCNSSCFGSVPIYRWRSAQGTWSSNTITSTEGDGGYRLVAGQDGTAHLFWSASNQKYANSTMPPRLSYYQRYQHGLPTQAAMLIDAQGIFSTPYLDPHERLILLGSSGDGTLYTETPFTHAGTESDFILAGTPNFMDWSADGTLHTFAPSSGGNRSWFYRFKAAGHHWSTPQAIDLNGYSFKGVALDERGQFHALTYDRRYVQFPPKVGAGQSDLAQTVTIPAGLHQPTLAWMAETQGGGNGDSNFQVRLGDGISETILYSTTAALPLQLQWADLSPWLGQTVTITFAVEQAANVIPFRVFLDHVALGAWETPVPQAVTPAQFAAGRETTMVISGENFIATPQVTLAGRALTNVRLLSATRLEATVPATMPPGLHDLVVTNPGGVLTVLPGAAKVGKQLYLPLLHR